MYGQCVLWFTIVKQEINGVNLSCKSLNLWFWRKDFLFYIRKSHRFSVNLH